MLLSKRLKLWELLIELANTHQLGDGSDMEEGRMLEWVLGCKGRSLDSASVVECSNLADEAPEVLFGLVSCEHSSRLEFLGEEQVEL